MPHDNCDVRPVEEFREQDTPLGFYNPPTEDGSRRGAYYINTSDLPGRPLHHIASLTYHEANPGHHFQLSIEQEIPDRPALRRFGGILASSAFAEGGACTASAWPTRWACTSTTGNGSACSRPRACAPLVW